MLIRFVESAVTVAAMFAVVWGINAPKRRRSA
jgi:hypothetical protein